MSKQVRWNRILAIRAIQRQMAEVQLSRCEAEAGNLANLSARILSIRHAAQPAVAMVDSVALRAGSELAARLDRATAALAEPKRSADQARDRQARVVRDAKQREMAVEKISLSVTAQADRLAAENTDKSFIQRKRRQKGGRR